jgi:phosphate transport system substrate-binding protein
MSESGFRTGRCPIQTLQEDDGPIRLGDLARQTGRDTDRLVQELQPWLKKGQVEEMRPLGAPERTLAKESVFYRWRRREDRLYVWEQEFFEGRHRVPALTWLAPRTHENKLKTRMMITMNSLKMKMLNVFTPAVLLVSAAWAGGLPEVNPMEVKGDIVTAGSSTVYPLTERMAERFRDEGYAGNITIDSIGTGAGFERFCKAGETDIANASRPIKDKEIELAKAIGRMPIGFRVGTDALAVVLSKQNTFVKNITMEQLAQLFSTATLWSEVDPAWPAEKIQRFSPGTDSGTFDYFVEEIFGKKKEPLLNAANLQLSEDDNVLAQGVAGSPYAIAYFGFAYYLENKDKVRDVSINGITPSAETVNDGTYPLARPLFLYSSANILKAKPQVAAFLNFYLTYVNEEVDEVGYFPAPAERLEDARTDLEQALY